MKLYVCRSQSSFRSSADSARLALRLAAVTFPALVVAGLTARDLASRTLNPLATSVSIVLHTAAAVPIDWFAMVKIEIASFIWTSGQHADALKSGAMLLYFGRSPSPSAPRLRCRCAGRPRVIRHDGTGRGIRGCRDVRDRTARPRRGVRPPGSCRGPGAAVGRQGRMMVTRSRRSLPASFSPSSCGAGASSPSGSSRGRRH